MSVFAALFSGVSGLQTFGSALGVSADNIVNVNTVGYKETQARFTTLVTETSSSSSFSPGGVGLRTQTLVSKQGLIQASTSATDLSVDGAGFFVVRQAASAESAEGEILFTRAGSFTPDAEGFLKNTAGLFLMGWEVDSQGSIPTNKGDLDSMVPIRTTNLTGLAEATDLVSMRANLQSTQTVSGDEATYNATLSGNNMASGTVDPDFQRSLQVFDSLGGVHTLLISALKSDVDNEWHIEIHADPDSDVNPIVPLVDGQVITGRLAFNDNGTLNVAGTSASLLAPVTVNWAASVGAASTPAPSSITFDFGTDGSTDGFSQFATGSTLISSNINGAVFGNVTGVSVGKDGFVTALFDNGLSSQVFKLPIAIFQNPDGLSRRQGNAYATSDQSGSFTIQEAGDGGAGTLAPSTLEASTVDLAAEFANLITTQRAFTASTRIITTADEMLDELNRIKR
jgi:flagellar hook protein FlgE